MTVTIRNPSDGWRSEREKKFIKSDDGGGRERLEAFLAPTFLETSSSKIFDSRFFVDSISPAELGLEGSGSKAQA